MPIAGSLYDRIEREIALHLSVARRGGMRAADRAVHERTAELFGEALRYMTDRDHALAERVQLCAQLRARLERRA